MRHLKQMVPIQPKPPSKDEGLQRLKSDIQLLLSSSTSYAYKSPAQEFEDTLTRHFAAWQKEPTAAQRIKDVVLAIRRRDPLAFTVGKNFAINEEELVKAKDLIRSQLENDRSVRLEAERVEAERIQSEKEERRRRIEEEKLKKKPWLKFQTTEKKHGSEQQRDTFDFGASFGSVRKDADHFVVPARIDTGPKYLKSIFEEDRRLDGKYTFFENKTERKHTSAPKIKIKSRENSFSKRGASPNPDSASKTTATKFVRDMIGRKPNVGENLNRSGSESSFQRAPNKPLVPLGPGGTPTARPLIPLPPTADKRQKLGEIDDFLKRNYGGR